MPLHTLRYMICRPTQYSFAYSIFPRFYSLWEPDYLESLKPKIPVYPTLNFQIKGYDYPILEKFQSFMHKLAEEMDFDVLNSYAVPPKELKVKRYKPNSDVIEAEFCLNLYQRNIQISHSSSIQLPNYVRILEATLPVGVGLKVENYNPDIENKRYVPDTELLSLKGELQEVLSQK